MADVDKFRILNKDYLPLPAMDESNNGHSGNNKENDLYYKAYSDDIKKKVAEDISVNGDSQQNKISTTDALQERKNEVLERANKKEYNHNNEDYHQGLQDYIVKYPESDKKYYDIQYELAKSQFTRGTVLPPKKEQAFLLPSGENDQYHIMHRMVERMISDDELRGYMNSAKCMFVQWNGQRRVYYSENGVCIITKSGNDWIFKTAWSKLDYDEDTETIMGVINKYVR